VESVVGVSVFWKGRSVLVTGGTGLLGSWLVKHLTESGANVACLVREGSAQRKLASDLSSNSNFCEVTFVVGDITDGALIARTLADRRTEVVFHLAAQAIVGVANRDPISTFRTNIEGTWNLLDACRRSSNISAVVVASSDKAYGEQPNLPYTEDMPLLGANPYDVSKACADRLAHSYAASFDLPVAITRCGNFYGGADLNWNRIVPGTIRSIFREERPIIRSDGKFIRDYIYIEDATAAYMTLAERLAADSSLRGQAFNFSYERKISALDIVKLILLKMNSELIPEVLNQASNEIRNQFLSAERAHKRLQWKPQFTLESGMDRTIAWYRNHFEAPIAIAQAARG
jgi:CDP-glucose 4,6-dehydratase